MTCKIICACQSCQKFQLKTVLFTFDCGEGKEQIAVGRYRHLRRVASVTVRVTVCSLSRVAGCVSRKVLAN